jgi:hypothetical protein
LSAGSTGLDLPPPLEGFETEEEVEAALAALDRAQGRLDRAAAIFLDDAAALVAAAAPVNAA